VKGINEAEVDRIIASRPYHSLTDFWHRARVSRPIAERLVLAGGFDAVYGIGSNLGAGVRRRGKVTRRDLLLQVAELDRHARAVERAGRGRGLAARRVALGPSVRPADVTATEAGERNSSDPLTRDGSRQARPTNAEGNFVDGRPARDGVWAKAAAQSKATRTPPPVTSVQLTLDLGDEPGDGEVSGLPEMDAEERMKAELEILGLDASRHVVDSFAEFLDELGATRSRDLF
jgi:error-prone DNA polymerase